MIIGISGKANSGKDTLADYIRLLDGSFEKRKFAGKLKKIASILTGIEDQYTRNGKSIYLPQWKMTVVEFQQRLGTDAIRNGLKEDAWILALFADYTQDCHWCITDLRFPNEASAVRERGGTLIRINRNISDDCGRDANHPSETSLDNWNDWDFVIDNNGSLEELESKVRYVMAKIEGLI